MGRGSVDECDGPLVGRRSCRLGGTAIQFKTVVYWVRAARVMIWVRCCPTKERAVSSAKGSCGRLIRLNLFRVVPGWLACERRADQFVNVGRAHQGRDVGQGRGLFAGERGPVSEFGLEIAQGSDGLVILAFGLRVELDNWLERRRGGAVFEEDFCFLAAGNAHVPTGVNDLAEEQTLDFAGRAEVVKKSGEDAVELGDLVGADRELGGINAVFAWVKVCHGAFRVSAGVAGLDLLCEAKFRK